MLPTEFSEYTSRIFGEERWEKYLRSFQEDTPVSIRLNPFKIDAQHLHLIGEGAEEVPWCRNAWWLKSRPRFTSDPLFHAGAYYVQEAGSMFLDTVIKTYITSPVCMLDLCAAPGGKSTLSMASLPEGSLLFTNEPDRRRSNILLENIIKQGHRNVVVTNNYAEAYRDGNIEFDVVLVDAPCSGEGLFRRDNAAIEEWSVKNVRKCAELQRSILSDIWNALKPGGLMIYSTCTFNLLEDEENVMFLSKEYGAEVLPVPIAEEWGITGSLHPDCHAPVYRFIPGVTKSEGLFLAVVRKPGVLQPTFPEKTKIMAKLKNKLHILYDGEPRGEKKGKDIVPAHAEALAIMPVEKAYPTVELSLEDALRYLHHESLTLPPEHPRGYLIVSYQGLSLGFVKNLGNRANNLYPKEWAIRVLK